LRSFYFRLYPGAIGELEVIDFLKALLRHIDGPLLIVWDRLPAPRLFGAISHILEPSRSIGRCTSFYRPWGASGVHSPFGGVVSLQVA